MRIPLKILGIAATWFLMVLAAAPAFAAIPLASQEQEWLHRHPVLRLAPDPDFEPIEFFDRDGVYRGVAADFVRTLEDKLGVKITIVRLKDGDEVMEKFKRHEVDLLGAIVPTPDREKFALFTSTLVTVPGGIFTVRQDARDLTLDDLAGGTVAVVSNYTAHDVLKRRYPDLVLDVVPDVSTGLAKGSLGMVDAYVENMANATYYSRKAGITNLRLAGATDFDYRWSIGVRRDWPELPPILNKGIAAIGEDERRMILDRWIAVRKEGWRPDRTLVFGVVASILVLLLGVSGAWNRSLRKARAAAQNNEHRFRTIFQSVADPVYIADSSGRVIAANEQASLETGYSPGDLPGMRVTDIAVSDETAKVEERFRENFSLSRGTFEAVHRRRDGTLFPVELNVRPIEYDGRPAVIGVARNITERKRMEEALRNAEERYRQLFEGISDAVFVHGITGENMPGRFVEVNEVACGRLGYSREELLRMSPRDIDAPESAVDVKAISERLARGESVLFEQVHVARDGRRIPVEINVRSFRVQDRLVVLSVVRDVSDRKRAEAEKDELQSQLQQAMKMEAVGRLAGGVAHDFNNILTAIIGNVSLALLQVPPSDPLAGMLSEANRAAERAAALTRQLLAFSRKQIMEAKVIDLNDLIANMSAMLARLIGENIELRTEPAEGPGVVKVDPGQFEQILVNLAVNARDAMPDGGRLRIGISHADLSGEPGARQTGLPPGKYVVLAVSDTGHGMSEEVKARMFEPFFTTKPTGRGTGLGLATVYGAVKQAGGSIEVRSEPGKGSTFRIILPGAGEQPPEGAGEELQAELAGGEETVLLVEDEDTVRDLCTRILSRVGYRVVPVANGRDALRLAGETKERIDLLLTDVVMPEMNGRVLAERLVRLHPETKVLFMSGYAEDVIVRHEVLEKGMSFIGKPYTPAELLRKVREVLDRA